MTQARITELGRRGVVVVEGADARTLINDLITSSLGEAGGAVFAGLLTPQGKLLFDFLVFEEGERFFFDIARDQVAPFLKRLALYRLRSKVEFADLSDDRVVLAAWGGDSPPRVDGVAAADPRLPALGFRAIAARDGGMPPDHATATEDDYDAHRIGLGVPEGGIDFAFGEVFPHDVDMDQLAGVDFAKGCFVGQEVVSRMKHRGTARRRFVMAQGATLPAAGTELSADGRPIGTMGSSSGTNGLALVRLDRAGEAMNDGVAIMADDRPVTLTIPPWATFDWPSAAATD